jgi:hypothetical protein
MLKLTVAELAEKIKVGETVFENIRCGVKPLKTYLGESPRVGLKFYNCDLRCDVLNYLDLEECSFIDCKGLPNFDGCDLCGINFEGSDLKFSSFRGTTFYGGLIVKKVIPPYAYSVFWAELLKRKAVTLDQKQVVALIYSGDYLGWCWDDFLAMNHPLQDWVVETLRSYELDLSTCPNKAKILLG